MLNRLKQYIDIKHISVSAFEKSIGMSNASFGKSLKNGGTIGADKLEIILNTYPDININWLVLNKGPMLISETKENVIKPTSEEKCPECKVLEAKLKVKEAMIYELYKDLISSKNEIIMLQKLKDSNNKSSEGGKIVAA